MQLSNACRTSFMLRNLTSVLPAELTYCTNDIDPDHVAITVASSISRPNKLALLLLIVFKCHQCRDVRQQILLALFGLIN